MAKAFVQTRPKLFHINVNGDLLFHLPLLAEFPHMYVDSLPIKKKNEISFDSIHTDCGEFYLFTERYEMPNLGSTQRIDRRGNGLISRFNLLHLPIQRILCAGLTCV